MFDWFKKPKAQPSKAASADFHLRLRLLRVQSPLPAPVTTPVKAEDATETVSALPCIDYESMGVSDTHELAGSLEQILQGTKVDQETFLKLFRGGYVEKKDDGQWKITERGKDLVEQNKLLTPKHCLINGIQCVKKWD